MISNIYMRSAAGALLAAAAFVAAGCSDDGASITGDDAGSGGSQNGSGGKSTSGGASGASGKAGASGAGGAATGGAGAGGTGTGGAAGASGGAGPDGGDDQDAGTGDGGAATDGGDAAVPLPNLSNTAGFVQTGVNALSGVTFGKGGKIYVSGDVNIIDASKATGDTPDAKYRSSVVGHKVVVMRFSTNGQRDNTFGTNGVATWEGPDNEVQSLGLAETDDESIIVDVNVRYPSKRTGVALVKFDKDGKLVSGFGTGGKKDIILGWTDADIGDYPKDTMGNARFPSDQSWDIKPSNGGAKVVVFAHGPAKHGLLDTSAPPVQRIDNDRYIFRFNSNDGSFDSAFNGGQPIVVNTPNDGAAAGKPVFPSDGGRHGLVLADGSIVSSGYTSYQDDGLTQIVLIRLEPDGTFDPAFHKERPGQPVLPGVAVFNPVPAADKGFAECYGVALTTKGYVTTGYGMAYAGTDPTSTLGYLPSVSVDMVSTRFTGTAVDTTYGKSGVLAAQSEGLGSAVSITEDRGRTSVIVLPDDRVVMGSRFGQYPALFVVTPAGTFDSSIKGVRAETDGRFLYPTLTSAEQPNTSMFYGLALSSDGKFIAAGTNNHEQGALLAILEVKSGGAIVPITP